MGKPTLDLCYSEETPAEAKLEVHASGFVGAGVGLGLGAKAKADGSEIQAIFGLAEIMRGYLFLESIGE